MEKSIKKNIINIAVIVVLCFFCFFIGRCTVLNSDKSSEYIAELKQTISELRTAHSNVSDELSKAREELELAYDNLYAIGAGVDGAIELAGQSDGLIRDIRQTNNNIGKSSSDARATINQLISNQRGINEYVTKLQDINKQLEEELGTVRGQATVSR